MIHNDTNFDNYVKDAFYNHKAPVPVGLWDKIVADKPTKKPLVFWWNNNKMYLLAAACLLLVSCIYLLVENKKEASFASKNETLLQNNNTPNNNNLSIQKTENTIDKKAILSNNSNQSSDNTFATNTDIHSQNFNTGKTVPNQNINRKFNQLLLKNQSNQNIFSNQSQGLHLNKNISTQQQIDKTFSETHYTRQNTISLTDLSKLEPKNPTSLLLINKKKIFGLDCPNALPTNWYLEAYGSPDYNMKNVYANGVSDAYLQRIDSTTKMGMGFTFGLRVSRSINEHLLVKTGLQYTQRNEQFTSKSDSLITTTNVVTIRTIVRGGGLSDTTVRDTSSLQQIGYRKRVTNNHYKSLEVPLLVSYERGNDKWRVAANGGVIVNLTSWYSGETLDTTYQPIPLSAKNNNGFIRVILT